MSLHVTDQDPLQALGHGHRSGRCIAHLVELVVGNGTHRLSDPWPTLPEQPDDLFLCHSGLLNGMARVGSSEVHRGELPALEHSLDPVDDPGR